MATERDNYVQLSLTGIKIVSFEEEDHCVSSGQPYDGVSVASDDKIEIKQEDFGTLKYIGAWFKHNLWWGCNRVDSDVQYPPN